MKWLFSTENFSVSNEIPISELRPGKVFTLGDITFDLPSSASAAKAILHCTLLHEELSIENSWNFWLYPELAATDSNNVRCSHTFGDAELSFIANGGRLLLLDDFPCPVSEEFYRPCSTGRSNGHYGSYVSRHPVMDSFPHENFLEFQIFNMMQPGRALLFPAASPLPFAPVVGLIPPYKLHQNKALISEFSVGKGRLILCTLKLDIDDPAAKFLKAQLLNYLSSGNFAPAPEVAPETLSAAAASKHALVSATLTDIAWDPNAGK